LQRFRRKDLKRDRFVEEVGERVEYFSAHRKQFVGGGVAVLVLLVGGVGYGGYARQRGIDSQAALLNATTLYGGVVTTESVPGLKTFATEAERVEEVTRALDKVTLDYAGTSAAAGAAYYSGLLDREQGNAIEAKAHFETAARGKGSEYPALAKLALGEMLFAEGDVEAARAYSKRLSTTPRGRSPRTARLSRSRERCCRATRNGPETYSPRFKLRTGPPALWQRI